MNPPTDIYVTVQEAAEIAGVTRPTIYAMIARKELPARTVAGRLVLRREDVPPKGEDNGA